MYSKNHLVEILKYINNNIDNEITINDLSNKLFFNRFYIMKSFKKEFGLSIIDYINKIKIYNSLSLYQYNDKILNIALKSGFNSLEYYSEIFKKVMGYSPRTYKKFINNNYLSTDIYNKIRTKIIILQTLKNNMNKYINNTKPETIKIKKLSIFK